MSSLLGVPVGISEDIISASFPTITTNTADPSVLEMQVKLCQILAKTDSSESLLVCYLAMLT